MNTTENCNEDAHSNNMENDEKVQCTTFKNINCEQIISKYLPQK